MQQPGWLKTLKSIWALLAFLRTGYVGKIFWWTFKLVIFLSLGASNQIDMTCIAPVWNKEKT
jgi:hypothetical protein